MLAQLTAVDSRMTRILNMWYDNAPTFIPAKELIDPSPVHAHPPATAPHLASRWVVSQSGALVMQWDEA